MPRRYRKDESGKLYLVKFHPAYPGIEGYEVKWTQDCSGCNEYSEGVLIAGPFGCRECGYTGKNRHTYWVPFDTGLWEAMWNNTLHTFRSETEEEV